MSGATGTSGGVMNCGRTETKDAVALNVSEPVCTIASAHAPRVTVLAFPSRPRETLVCVNNRL